MSFILDALKKSEAERQRQASPGLIEPAVVQARGGPTPLTLGLLALLAVNSLVLGIVLLRRPSASPPSSVRPAATVAALPGAAPVAPVASVAPAAPAALLPDAVSTTNGASAPSSGEATEFAPEVPVTSPESPIVAEARARLSLAGAAVAGRDADLEHLPTLAQMRFTGADALPPLHLDVHVYSPDPARRFVFINGHKYLEGSTLVEGPRVERIRPDGVELAYRGRRFLLPRR